MSLKNLTRSIVLAALAAVCAATVLAETKADPSTPPMKTAAAHARRDDRSASSATAQSDLIGELLGIAGSKSTQEALSPSGADSATVIQLVARQSETTAKSTTAKTDSQNGNGSLGSMFGRLIRIDVDTNTVDIQFEGSRQTTVGSKFSVEHDYAFTTEYLGKIEVVYLAGGNRAIAKPRDKWNGPLARSWGIRLNRNSPATVLVTRHSPTPTTPPWRSKSLWCAVQPKSVESASPTQTAALPARPASLAAIVLFECE